MVFRLLRRNNLKLISSVCCSASSSTKPKNISQDIVESLEHLSLVDFPNAEAVRCLEDAVSFTDKLLEVNTDHVEPLISTVHVRNQHFRNDDVTEISRRDKLMKLAGVTEEYYYVAPPGNISLKQKKKDEDMIFQ